MPAQPLRLLSVMPPMTQLNTPHPSTAYLTGFLRARGVPAVQEDLAPALILKLLSRRGLLALRDAIAALPESQGTPLVGTFSEHFACNRIEHALAQVA